MSQRFASLNTLKNGGEVRTGTVQQEGTNLGYFLVNKKALTYYLTVARLTQNEL